MDNNVNKERAIIFYGSDYTPLSEACWGCDFYNYLCPGSVYVNGECGSGQVEDPKPSIAASNMFFEANENQFLLARALGYDLSFVKQDDLDLDEDLHKKYNEAVQTPSEVIESYKKKYELDKYGFIEQKQG